MSDSINISEAVKSFKDERTNKEALGIIADLLDRNNIDVDEVGKITRVSLYQTAAKDADGEIQTKDLVGIQISPKWEQGPEWPVVQPAKPVVINSPKKPNKAPALIGGWKQAVILPDPQIGFRQFDDKLDPFHDDAAMNVALQVTAALEHENGVDQVVNLGDFLDLPAQGKYEQEAAFAFTTQQAIDRGHLFLGEQRAAAPNAKIVVLEGNHDRRMQKFVQANALAAFGLRRANVPDSWPVMSLPYLLRLDELDIEYIDAYPAGMWWINDSLRAIHGDKVNSGGSTAMKYTNEMPHISTVFGHIHRQEIQSKTTFDRAGKIKAMAISPGCLCRVDGAVPSVKGSVGIDGRPVTYYENWQQGISVITYKPEGSFHVELVHIDDGKTLFRGQEFKAAV
jgi:predicted phosphodiesterase